MNLKELLSLELHLSGKKILLLGRPSAGKTWLSNKINDLEHKTIHTDNFLEFAEPMAVQAIIEDEADIRRYYDAGSIIEGMLGYPLLLTGLKEQSYLPDIIIICEISAGRQREIYLSERDPSKLQFQKRFNIKCQGILHECYKLMANLEKERYPNIIIFTNEY